MKCSFIYNRKGFRVKEAGKIRKWLSKVIRSEKRTPGEITFVFMDDRSLLKMNREFLKHDYFTDIITFDYTEGKTLNAEIFISVDRVKDNAADLGLSFESELRRVMVHGVLHLCGYKDKSAPQKRKMRKAEDNALLLFNAC